MTTAWGFHDARPRPPGLTFSILGGAGDVSCRDCGHGERITSFLHGLDWSASGYQRQQCGKLHVIDNARSMPAPAPCDCGGTLSREDVLFCPSCRSTKLVYEMRIIM